MWPKYHYKGAVISLNCVNNKDVQKSVTFFRHNKVWFSSNAWTSVFPSALEKIMFFWKSVSLWFTTLWTACQSASPEDLSDQWPAERRALWWGSEWWSLKWMRRGGYEQIALYHLDEEAPGPPSGHAELHIANPQWTEMPSGLEHLQIENIGWAYYKICG